MRTVVGLAMLAASAARSGVALDPPKEGDAWQRIAVGDVLVVSNAEPAVLERVAGDLASVRPALARASGLDLRNPVTTTVFVFRSGSGFRPYREALLGRRSEASAVHLQLPDGDFVLLDGSRLDDAMPVPSRGVAGLALGSSVPGLPPWAREGLSELAATIARTPRGVTLGRPVAEHLRVLRAQPPVPVARLLAATSETPELAAWTRQGVFTAESWALAHVLLLGDERRDRLPRYLAVVAGGGTVEAGLAEAFGITALEVEREIQRLVAGDRHPLLELAASELAVPALPAPAAVSRGELLFLLGNVLTHARAANTADAEAFLTEAIALEPGLAVAYTVRAMIQTRFGLDAAAVADLEKGVSLDSSDPRPTLYYADYLAERLAGKVRRGTPAPPEELARVRALYRRSLELDPGRSRTWAGLGFTYLLEPGDPGDGIAALERCLALEPAHVQAAFNLVLLYVRAGRRDEAAALIERVVRPGPDRALEMSARDALLVADLRRADELVAAGHGEEGISILERARAEATSEKVRAEAGRRLEAARRNAEIARQAARFDEALTRVRERDYVGAMAILKELEPVALDGELLQAIAETEADILPFLTPKH